MRKFPSDGAVICPACLTRSMTACQDEIRDADRLIPLSRSSRIVEDDLISIEISPIGIIAHLAPCHLIRRQSAGTSSVPMLLRHRRHFIGTALDESAQVLRVILLPAQRGGNLVRSSRHQRRQPGWAALPPRHVSFRIDVAPTMSNVLNRLLPCFDNLPRRATASAFTAAAIVASRFLMRTVSISI